MGPTDLLLFLFFEVDTGIMEVEVLGSRDFPGVWNACAVDFGLDGEEGLDLACELAVGKAKPIDFRGFGVSGVEEDPENRNLDIRFVSRNPSQANNVHTWVRIALLVLLLLHVPCLPTASLRLSRQIRRTLLLLFQYISLSAPRSG